MRPAIIIVDMVKDSFREEHQFPITQEAQPIIPRINNLLQQGRALEIPIIFADRRVGISKMNRKIIFEATWMVWRLFLLRLFTRVKPAPAVAARLENADRGQIPASRARASQSGSSLRSGPDS